MSDKTKVLITGGAGYIGSHTCVELISNGFDVVVVDNLANSKADSLKRVEQLTGQQIIFYEGDLRDTDFLNSVFEKHLIDAVIHFAGYKAVGESVEKPLLYYSNNVAASINLLETMMNYNVNNIVFSSSCTVYGKPERVPVRETDTLKPTNPYGRSKLMVEQILQDLFTSNNDMSVSILRYFNPIGAHSSGLIGEDPKGIPNNLLPFVTKVAAGELNELNIFGDDYDTHDGTGVRDYLHVVDLAKAHVIALEKILETESFIDVYNLGTGEGYSVLDVVKAFENATKVKIPYKVVDRRPGDVDETFSDPSKVNNQLGWHADRDLHDMCRDSWLWQKQTKTNDSNNI